MDAQHTAAMLDAAKAELQTVKEEGVTHSGVVSEAIIHRDEAIKKVRMLFIGDFLSDCRNGSLRAVGEMLFFHGHIPACFVSCTAFAIVAFAIVVRRSCFALQFVNDVCAHRWRI